MEESSYLISRFDQVALLITAVGTAFTALAAFLSANETRRTVQAQLLSKFLDDYSSQPMLDHLHAVRQFYDKVMDYLSPELPSFAYKDEVDKVDPARRYVKHYFFKAQILKNAGYVDEQFVKTICEQQAGFRLLFSAIEPLEEKEGLKEENDAEIYNQLRVHYKPTENPLTELLRILKERSESEKSKA